MTYRLPGVQRDGRIWGITLLVIGCFVWSLAGCDRARTRAVRQLKQGIKLAQEKSWSDATEKMKKAAEIDPDYAKPHYQLAQIYETEYKVGDHLEKAERHYREALSIKPDDVQYNYKFGRLLATMGEHEDALERFEKVVEQDEDHAKALFRMGRSYRRLAKHAEAVDSFMKSIRAAPRMRMGSDDPGGAHYHALGNLYLEFGFYDKANQVYENGITNNEKSARLYLGRGKAQYGVPRYEDAIESFEKAREIRNPGKYAVSDAKVLYNLAAAQHKAGQYDRAMKTLESFVQSGGGGDGSAARLATAQGLMEKIERSKRSEEKEN